MDTTGEDLKLSVIFVQYDREKYPLSLEKLVSLLVGLESIDFKIVVVDNANPGFWQHGLSDHVVQIGGENSAWEFSAFDHGVAYLAQEGGRADVYAFVTDAFLAYGEDYLQLIDKDGVRFCQEQKACVGWVDSFMQDLTACGYHYRDWMRTSFFFLPADHLATVTPLTTPLETGLIFGPTANTPFLDSAPLNATLQEHLLAWLAPDATDVALKETWHSRMELSADSFDFFKSKVAAILREHLLSARLQALGIPVYDFRLVRRVIAATLDPSRITPVEKKEWQWLAGRDAEIEKQPQHHLDQYLAPRTLVHGDSRELKLIGWVATEPQVREVTVRLSDGQELGGTCDIPRPDAIEALPGYSLELCGFELTANLDCLAPGTYSAEWIVPEFGISEDLGQIDVTPRLSFEPKRCFVPDSAFPGQTIPVVIEGTFESSFELSSVTCRWNGKIVKIEADFFKLRRRANGIYVYKVDVLGDVAYSGKALQQRLELEFLCKLPTELAEAGEPPRYTWKRFHAINSEAKRPHTLTLTQIGPIDPKSGSMPIHIRGGVLTGKPKDRLALRWGETTLFEERLGALASTEDRIAWFEIQREVQKIPVGTWDFSLSLGQGSSREVFAEWRDRVTLTEPVIHIEHRDVAAPGGNTSPFVLKLVGWIEHHDLVDRLLLKLDGELVATLGIDRFRKDIATERSETLIKNQGFEVEVKLDAPAGEHKVQLVTVQEDGPTATWEETLLLGVPSAESFLVDSAQLNELEAVGESHFWSSITISGKVLTQIKKITATLEIDGEEIDQLPIGSNGHFMVSHTPRKAGQHKLRVSFAAKGKTLYKSARVDVSFVPMAPPQNLSANLGRFVNAFKLRKYLKLGKSQQLARALVEREREALPEILEMLERIGASLASKGREVVDVPRPGPKDVQPLKVLFATWEVPCSRHGGGVWMMNLLKVLGSRHKITLIHAYGPGEEEWVDDVRKDVEKVISIPRIHQPSQFKGDARVPAHYYDNYTPALRAAIEAEIYTGDYDIVDYEYTRMLPHMSKVNDVPQVLSVLENAFLSELTDLKDKTVKKRASQSDGIDRLRDLLKSFYLMTSALPRLSPNIVAITEKDAESLRKHQTESRIYVNTIGVDTDHKIPDEVSKEFLRDRPTLVFMGSYRHAPNEEAALFLAEKVMPRLRRKKSLNAELVLLGSHPTQEIIEHGSRDDITVTGYVDDYQPYLFAGNVFVAPIFKGAGMRVKMLEAMACGIPVIGTTLSMRSIGAKDGEHFYSAKKSTDFAKSIERCLKNPDEARAVGLKGRELVAERHSYRVKARDREAIWYAAIRDWQHPRAATSPTSPRPAEPRPFTLVR